MSRACLVPEPDDAGSSQAVKAQLRLREMILAGELPAGARIAELASSSAWACRARRSVPR